MRRRVTSALTLGALIGMTGFMPITPVEATSDQTDRTEQEQEQERATYLGRELYTGELHSHTSVSDGVELPPDAFEHVANHTEADFFTVSEHDVMWDIRNGDDFVEDWREAASEEWRWVHQQAFEYNETHEDLTVVPAVENTWYDGTGHINVFNTDWHATARATEKGSNDGFGNNFGTGDMKYDMYTFFARLKLDPNAIAQFNHPRPTGKGNFFDFNGLDRVVDDRVELIEVRDEGQFDQFQKALDKGWHLGPVWNGDEHAANWVTSNESITGIWARGHSLEALYAAMQERSVYSTQDVNAVLAFGADDSMMGSILPADTTSPTFEVRLNDPDDEDSFTSVQLFTNGGEVAHEFEIGADQELEFSVNLDVEEGDFYYIRADQADGDFLVSAPIWIGETTRGANYAPVITVPDQFLTHAGYGQTIALPDATAVDDSGQTPTISYEVYNSAGEVAVSDGRFEIRSYDDYFVVVKATDDTGNIGAELLRITIDQDTLDPTGVFQYFGSTAAVAAKPGGTGIAVTTDRSIEKVYAQVTPAGEEDWDSAQVLTSSDDDAYEVNTVGNDEPVFQHSITGQTLRSHEFDVTGLTNGQRYVYRFGVAVDGHAPAATDSSAWTEVRGEFVAEGAQNDPIYVVGDLQVKSHDPNDLGMLRNVLDRLQTEVPGGGTVIQTGDLVDRGGRGKYWDEVFEHVFKGLDLQVAPVAGNHETYGDLNYNSQSNERAAIFASMYDLPEGGAVGESSYSFDRGDIHFAVLNSVAGIEAQLAWLREDIRASTKEWNVVVGHYSYYGGLHGDDAALAADRPKITEALDELGVDLYIGAHDHVYKRSTIYEGELAETPQEERLGTTYVTMGSAGPKFYDNVPHWWDDVVFDEDTQMGGVLQVTDEGLKMTTYTIDGRVIDSFTVTKPRGHWEVASTDIVDRKMAGVGFLSYPGSRDELTVAAATYDRSQQHMTAIRTAEVSLDHRGREQFVAFDSPLPVDPSETVRLFLWNSLAGGEPLAPATTLREGLDGSGTAEDPYLIQSAQDLPKLANDPDGVYLLTTDLDLSDVTMSQLGRLVSFEGVFDGGGHTISGYTAPPDEGAGLFADNHGTIRHLAVQAEIISDTANSGILADVNHGLIEGVRTAGTITAPERVGGIVGDHYGVLRDSYSTADVHATATYAGGVVGLGRSHSVTENVFSTGAVTSDTRNSGGVVSYGYENTAVKHVVALNSLVSAPTYAHAVVGRVASGQRALLEGNYVSAAVPVSGESLEAPPTADNWKGEVVPLAEVRTQAFFEGIGWDFANVWAWSEQGNRPILQAVPEDVPPPPAPDLPQDGDGAYVVDEAAELSLVGKFPQYHYVLAADLDLSETEFTPLASGAFTGEFDGAGHTITGLTSTAGGLFSVLDGSVHDLGIVGADISSTSDAVGIVANETTAAGTIERVFVTGEIEGASYVGGLVGSHSGTISDSYSLADVSTTNGRYAGGIAGVPRAGSITERTYATGAIRSVDQSAGGITGYSYTGTIVRNNFALNSTVSATNFAQRVVARMSSGDNPTLENNFAIETLLPAVQDNTAVGASTLNGETKTRAEARDQQTWAEGLGWDFDTVWQWSEEGQRPILQSAVEAVESSPQEPEAPELKQADDGTYLIQNVADLSEAASWPAESFRLTTDLDVTGEDLPQFGLLAPFSGEFDGTGHRIVGLASDDGGLFGVIAAEGAVHDLHLEGTVTGGREGAGLLARTTHGTIERVSTAGSVTAQFRAGGIAGTSFGTIRDSYSTAAVSTTTGDYAGGIVGVADSPSLTERVYATGVIASGRDTAGGLAGYARNSETVVRSSVALNPSVSGDSFTQRVVARSESGETATLSNNYAITTLVAQEQEDTSEGPATLNGGTLTVEKARDADTWSDTLGWDFAAVWAWDSESQQPVLRHSASAPPAGGAVTGGHAGFSPMRGLAAGTIAAPFADTQTATDISHEATSIQDGVTSLKLHAGADAAGEQVSLLVVEGEAAARQPAPDNIVYLNEVTADEDGNATFAVALPGAAAESDYWIAADTSGETERYVAPLMEKDSGEEGSDGPEGSDGSEGSNGSEGSDGDEESEKPNGSSDTESNGGESGGGIPGDDGPMGNDGSVDPVGAGADGETDATGGDPDGAAPGGMPSTGSVVWPMVATAVLALLVGAGILHLRRRSSGRSVRHRH